MPKPVATRRTAPYSPLLTPRAGCTSKRPKMTISSAKLGMSAAIHSGRAAHQAPLPVSGWGKPRG